MAENNNGLKVAQTSITAQGDNTSSDIFYNLSMPDTAIIPGWGQRLRDRWLRDYFYTLHNQMLTSVLTSVMRKVAQTSWEISGKRNVKYFQDLFIFADPANEAPGWEGFVMRVVQDYLTQDFGAFMEVIAPGNPDEPVRAKVLGLAHVDSFRVIPNPYTDTDKNKQVKERYEYPYFFLSDGGWVKMHRTRIARMVDSPSPKRVMRGNGQCAMSRGISTGYGQILVRKYIIERLSDQPPAGIMVAHNIKNLDALIKRHQAENEARGNDVYNRMMTAESLAMNEKPSIETHFFSNLPEAFNRREYNEEDAIELALAIGVDVQDIRPLSSSNGIGNTATQSTILSAKGRGKMLAGIYAMFERLFNFYILPESLQFQFKPEDGEADKEAASNAKLWVETVNTFSDITSDERRRMIANQVLAFADVLLDEDGTVRVFDDDPKETEQPIQIAQVVTDEQAMQDNPSADAPVPSDEETATDTVERGLHRRSHMGVVRRAYDSTYADFIAAAQETFDAAASGSLNRRRAGIVLRAHLRRFGLEAFRDGLADGGIDDRALDTDDQATFNSWLTTQSSFVTAALNRIRDGGTANARLWANRSLTPAYQAGLLSADRNGLYEWKLGNTEEHCTDCLRLNGQKHRLKDWHNRIVPQSGELECGGFNCDCRLSRTTGRASGRF